MCLIIDRQPGILFPEDKLEAAAINNGDGFGAALIDRGKVEIIKVYNGKNNDPDEVLRFFGDNKDVRILCHLRMKTHGTISQDNCHPFAILGDDLARGGNQFFLMHNGVLSAFAGDDNTKVDSDNFGQWIVRPMIERALYDLTYEEVLDDPLLNRVVSHICGTSSVITLFDERGNVKHFNMQRGMKGEGWCVSNTYSFTKPSWRAATTTGGTNNTPETSGTVLALPPVSTTPKVDTRKHRTWPQVPARKSFLEMCKEIEGATFNADELEMRDLVYLTGDDLDVLIDEYPEQARALMQDLILELYGSIKDAEKIKVSAP